MASWDERAARVAERVGRRFRRAGATTYSHAGGAAQTLADGALLHNPRLSGERAAGGLAGELGAQIEADRPRAEIPVAALAAIGVSEPDNGDVLTIAGTGYTVRTVEQNADETVWLLGLREAVS